MYTLKDFLRNLEKDARACSYLNKGMLNSTVIEAINEALPRKYVIIQGFHEYPETKEGILNPMPKGKPIT